MSYAPGVSAVLGRTEPRLWTPPLRELTPATSVGFDQVEFAGDVLRRPLDPWQKWLAIHAGELLPDGRPRFRVVLVLVARQNGKTELLVILTTYWQFVDAMPLTLGTSTKLDYAKESWSKAVKLADGCPDLDELRPRPRWYREANGEQESWTTEGSRYKIAASNAEGGRSLTINRLVMDELRQHRDYSAWDAAEPAASPFDAQVWCLSNAGDDCSVVLNDLRESALAFIEWTDEVGAEHVGELLAQAPGDYRLGLFEWSAPENADPTDLDALAMANPNLGRRKDPETLLLAARRAVAKGGDVLTGFRTEQMCIRVPKLEQVPEAIPAEVWEKLLDPVSTPLRDVAFFVDVKPDRSQSAICAYGPRRDGRGHVELVAYRPGTAWLVPAMARLKVLHDPVAFGLDVKGPAGSLVARLATVGIRVPDKPGEPRRGDLALMGASDVAAAWGAFLDAVDADVIRHRGQVPLTAAVASARTRPLGAAEALARRTAAGDICPVVAAVGARWVYVDRVDRLVPDEADPGAWVL